MITACLVFQKYSAVLSGNGLLIGYNINSCYCFCVLQSGDAAIGECRCQCRAVKSITKIVSKIVT